MLIRAMRTSSETLACRIAALLEEGSIWQGGPLDKPVDVEGCARRYGRWAI